MRHSAKEYAAALADVLSVSPQAKWNRVAERFLDMLVKNGDWQKADKILALTQELLIKKSGGRKIVVETARPVSVEKITNQFFGNKDLIEKKITPELIAGVRITIDDRQLDLSFTRLMQDVFQNFESPL